MNIRGIVILGALLAGVLSAFTLKAWLFFAFLALGCGFLFFLSRSPKGWILTGCYLAGQLTCGFVQTIHDSSKSPNFTEAPLEYYLLIVMLLLDIPILLGGFFGFLMRRNLKFKL